MVNMQIVRAGKSARELSLRTVTRRLELVASDCIVVEVWPLEGIKVRSCTLCDTGWAPTPALLLLSSQLPPMSCYRLWLGLPVWVHMHQHTCCCMQDNPSSIWAVPMCSMQDMSRLVRGVARNELSERMQKLLKDDPGAGTMICNAYEGLDSPAWGAAGAKHLCS